MDQDCQHEQWWTRSERLLNKAADEARRLQHSYLGIEHLFIALMRKPEDLAAKLVRLVGIDPSHLRDAIRREAGTGKAAAMGVPPVTPRLAEVLRRAGQCAEGESPMSEAEILRALFEEGESLPVRYLASFGFQPAALLAKLGMIAGGGSADQTRLVGSPGPTGNAGLPPQEPSSPSETAQTLSASVAAGPPIIPKTELPVSMPTPTLDHWGRDLCKLAATYSPLPDHPVYRSPAPHTQQTSLHESESLFSSHHALYKPAPDDVRRWA